MAAKNDAEVSGSIAAPAVRVTPNSSASVPHRLGPPRVVNITDLRRLAQARLPRVVFDYLDGGAEDERTMGDNAQALDEVLFRPRLAVKTPQVDLRTRVLGLDLQVPFLLAPIGYSSLMHTMGELVAASGAERAGTSYILPTISGHRLEEVHKRNPASCMQLYLLGGREAAAEMLVRADRVGMRALFVTIDTPVPGNRERDLRNGMKQLLGSNPFAKAKYVPNILAHPGWLLDYLMSGGRLTMPNVIKNGAAMRVTDVAAALEAAQVCWDDLGWIRQAWRGPIVIKGVHTVEDAKLAVQHGAAAIVVSNHGGRQLDGVAGSLRILPAIVDAVGGQCEVLFDGGVRRGSDVVKALCLGAKAVLVGRAYAYGMAAAGEAGVNRAVEILRADIVRTMQLLGAGSIGELNPSHVSIRKGFHAD